MNIRFDVSTLAKPAYQGLYAVSESLAASSLGGGFKHLVDLRVSQINKCLFCQNLHIEWGLRDGVGQDRLDAVADWAKSDLFTLAEKSALAWAEALTRQQEECVPALLADLRTHYSEQQIAELTMIIGVINAWNRLGISAYDHG